MFAFQPSSEVALCSFILIFCKIPPVVPNCRDLGAKCLLQPDIQLVNNVTELHVGIIEIRLHEQRFATRHVLRVEHFQLNSLGIQLSGAFGSGSLDAIAYQCSIIEDPESVGYSTSIQPGVVQNTKQTRILLRPKLALNTGKSMASLAGFQLSSVLQQSRSLIKSLLCLTLRMTYRWIIPHHETELLKW